MLRLTYEEFTAEPVERRSSRVAAFAGLDDDPTWRQDIESDSVQKPEQLVEDGTASGGGRQPSRKCRRVS